MKERTFYIAIGHFCKKRSDYGGQTCPIVIVNRKEHILDIQEMAVWLSVS